MKTLTNNELKDIHGGFFFGEAKPQSFSFRPGTGNDDFTIIWTPDGTPQKLITESALVAGALIAKYVFKVKGIPPIQINPPNFT